MFFENRMKSRFDANVKKLREAADDKGDLTPQQSHDLAELYQQTEKQRNESRLAGEEDSKDGNENKLEALKDRINEVGST